MTIIIGSDHAGFEYKQQLISHFNKHNIKYEDVGTYSNASCDYPDYAHAVANKINDTTQGVLICGSANGVAISANKHPNIRAAIAWNVEVAMLARQHNNANIICLPARFISTNLMIKCFESFIKTSFEGGRHEARVIKITGKNLNNNL